MVCMSNFSAGKIRHLEAFFRKFFECELENTASTVEVDSNFLLT